MPAREPLRTVLSSSALRIHEQRMSEMALLGPFGGHASGTGHQGVIGTGGGGKRGTKSHDIASHSIRPPAPAWAAVADEDNPSAEYHSIMLVKLAAQWELRKFYERKGLQMPTMPSHLDRMRSEAKAALKQASSSPNLLGSATAPAMHRRAPPPPGATRAPPPLPPRTVAHERHFDPSGARVAEPPPEAVDASEPPLPPEPRFLVLARRRGLFDDVRLLETLYSAPRHRKAPVSPNPLERSYTRAVQRQIDDMTSEQAMLHERLPATPAFRMMPESKQLRLLRICQEIGSNCKVT